MSCGSFMPIEICKYRDFYKQITIDHGNGEIDLSGRLFKGQVKTEDVVLLEFNFIVDGTKLTVSASDVETGLIPAGVFQYDIKMTDENGFDSTLIYGRCTVKNSITE